MKERCKDCGMLRSTKDLVLLEDESYICFSCWNKYVKEKAEVIYFVGCVSSFSPRTFKIPRSIVQIFQKAGIDFALLGDDEWCCGFPLLSSGFAKDFIGFA